MSVQDMLTYLNTHIEDDTQTRIIHYLFKNYANIEYMSITQIADACYTSTATISRFSKNFGFPSFPNMKEQITSTMSIKKPRFLFRMSKNSLSQLTKDPKNFYEHFAQEISESITDVVDSISATKIDDLVKEIMKATNVTFFGYDIMNNSLQIFQHALLNCGIIVQMSRSPQIQLEQAKKLDKHSLAIVCSSFGNFFSRESKVYDMVIGSPAKTILITQIPNTQYAAAFDQIISISSHINAEAGSYPMDFLLDYMARRAFVIKRPN